MCKTYLTGLRNTYTLSLFLLASFLLLNITICWSQNDIKLPTPLRETLATHKSKDTVLFNALMDASYIFRRNLSFDQAFHYNTEALDVAKSLNSPHLLTRAYLSKGDIYSDFGLIDEAIQSARKVISIAEQIESTTISLKQTIEAHDLIISCHLNQAQYNKALEPALKAIHIVDQNPDIHHPYIRASLHSQIAYIYLRTGHHSKWFYHIQISNDLCKTFDIKDLLSNNYIIIGSRYLELDHASKALTYFKRSLDLFKDKKCTASLAQVKNYMASCYIALNDTYHALIMLEEARDFFTTNNIDFGIAQNDYIFGQYYLKLGQDDKALFYLNSSLTKAKELNLPLIIIDCLEELIRYYEQHAEFNKALSLLDQHSNLLEEMEFSDATLLIYENSYRLYTKIGDLKNSSLYLEKYNTYKDSIASINNENQMATLETVLQYEQLNSDLQKKSMALRLSQSKEESAITLNIILIILTIILISFGIYAYQKTKKINHLKQQSWDAQEKLLEIKKDQLLHQVNFKNSQITELAIHLKEKNLLLKSLKNKIVTIKNDQQFNEASIREILLSINEDIKRNTEKINFYKEVDNTKDSFLLRLTQEYPELSSREQRVITLIRLGKSTKEVAIAMEISVSSVNNYRFSIRKKMQLDTQVNLNKFIMSL